MTPSPQKIFIAGNWVESSKVLPVINPYTGKVLTQTFFADNPQIQTALQESSKSFEKTRRLPSSQRAEICSVVARKIDDLGEDFAELIVEEAGKQVSDALREVKRASSIFLNAAEEARRFGGDLIPLDLTPGSEGRYGIYRRFPIGPLFAVTPFNFPLNLVAHKVAPAIACGCPFILKPSPKTPLTALLLAGVLEKAGLFPGGFSVFPAENADTEKITADERIKVLSFTGSAAVGWKLKGLAPKKKVLLELGGNAAVVVEPDARLDFALNRIVAGGFGYAGQTCISVQRVYLHESIFKKALGLLVPRVKGLKSGNPAQKETQLGPLISEDAAKRVEAWVKEAIQDGAQLLCGGKRNGSFYEPTLLTNVKPELKVSCEEIFGPVVVMEPYSDYSKTLALVNEGPYGLQAGVFTFDIRKIQQAYETLEVGTVLINEIPTYRVDSMPYGGVKDSGFGREGVKYAMEEYTEPRLLVLNPTGDVPG
jgi:acyl-CoA reductase-like NAD-dependent aldehyde dehydrogenase